MPQKTLLIVEDETSLRLMIRDHLETSGYNVMPAADGSEALTRLEVQTPDLMLLDLNMPVIDGLTVLERLQQKQMTVPTIVMTGYDTIDSALKTRSLGIRHFLAKPLDLDDVLVKVEEVLSLRQVEASRGRRTRELKKKFDFSGLLGESPVMLALKEMLALVAPSHASVLITGESGVGKNLAAQAVLKNSPRKNGPFISVNCDALPEQLLESELFGYEKGAVSGAERRKPGAFELADQGTLFLDKIGEMALPTQARLLKALKTRSFERLGGAKTIKVDVRLLAATNRDLETEIENRRFRGDLYEHLSAVRIHVPRLRDRGPDDIEELAEHILHQSARRNPHGKKTFSQQAMQALKASPWPGNVRELMNAVERAVILARGDVVKRDDLPLSVQNWSQGTVKPAPGRKGLTPGMTIKEVEAELISRTLVETSGNRSKAALMLGITRQTLLNKIREYGLNS